MWRKIHTEVDYPTKNLDLSKFVTDQGLLKNMGIETKYNLHGTINHYGNITFGHYKAFLKNSFENKWYIYDDEVISEVSDSGFEK